MAIDLLNRFTASQVNNVTISSGETSSQSSEAAAAIVRSVYALKAGDSIQGELIFAKGTDISLLLGETVTLGAKLDKELSLTPGQIMTFTVNSNKNGKLSLSPLFANTGMEQNAIKALDAASVPVTDRTLAMAEELMKQGMPINKQTLSNVFRQMGMFPDAGITDLVMLNKMNIPVNSENVSMMQLYNTNQQYLFSDLQGLSGQSSSFVSEMMASGQQDMAASFIRGFMQIFGSAENANAALSGGEVQTLHLNAADALAGDGMMDAPIVMSDAKAPIPGADSSRVIITENGISSDLSAVLPDASNRIEEDILKMLEDGSFRSSEGRAQLTESLFSILKEQMLMKPEDIKSQEYIKDFYERLDEQVGKLQELVKNTGKENSTLGKEVNTVKSNIQFMNQINELYHYVQLPVKMDNAHANGDLYVYKRKHAKTGEDGRLTALLHLSMPTLGNMDIFLELKEQKLSTKFCLEKEEYIDFIESNIDRLNDRLMKKGYQVQTSVTVAQKDDKTVIEHIMENELPLPVMSSQSFDARC